MHRFFSSAMSVAESIVAKAVPSRSRKGIWQGVVIQYGNMVSHSERKTRRRWLPNVQKINFHSELLGETIKIPVTTRALRTIEKKGGIDNYLLYSRPSLYEGSEIAQRLREKLIGEWEWKEKRAFHRRSEVFNLKMEATQRNEEDKKRSSQTTTTTTKTKTT